MSLLITRGCFIQEDTEVCSFFHSFFPLKGLCSLERTKQGLSRHGRESLTRCDTCQLVCPGTNEASLPPLTPCHGQSASSSLVITEGEHSHHARVPESPGHRVPLLLSQPGPGQSQGGPPPSPSQPSRLPLLPSAQPIRPLTPGATDKLFLSLALCLSLGPQRRGSWRGGGGDGIFHA